MANSFQTEQEDPDIVTIAELADSLVYRLPGCADIMIRKTIQDVYREFCRETECLTAERVIDLVDGEPSYCVSALFGGVVGQVREVWIDRRRLLCGSDYDIRSGAATVVVLDRRFVCIGGTDADDDYSPTISPSPWCEAESYARADNRTMRVLATEYPKIGSERAPSWFVNRYGDAICSGVLSRLMAMTGKAWSDAQQALDERRRYENLKSEARMFRETPSDHRFIDTSMVL